MNYIIEDSDLFTKISSLNLSIPESITFLPENIEKVNNENELIFADSTIDIRKLFRLNSVETTELIPISKSYNRKAADFYGPAIFVSLSMLSENPNVVSVALNLLSSYIYDRFKGTTGSKKVKLEIYVETKKNKAVKKIIYDGDASELHKLKDIIKTL
jgi:hypothetical protein